MKVLRMSSEAVHVVCCCAEPREAELQSRLVPTTPYHSNFKRVGSAGFQLVPL